MKLRDAIFVFLIAGLFYFNYVSKKEMEQMHKNTILKIGWNYEMIAELKEHKKNFAFIDGMFKFIGKRQGDMFKDIKSINDDLSKIRTLVYEINADAKLTTDIKESIDKLNRSLLNLEFAVSQVEKRLKSSTSEDLPVTSKLFYKKQFEELKSTIDKLEIYLRYKTPEYKKY